MIRVLVADPPWKFGDRLPGAGRGAEKHYPCLSVAELCAFPIPRVADDAVLLLWRVASMPREALDVVESWGFEVKSEIVWRKTTVHGKRHFGMGRQVRMEHEVALIATRGRIAARDKSVRSVFDAPTGRHSAKPELFYDIVERLYEGPYAELFARRSRPGWACLGNDPALISAA